MKTKLFFATLMIFALSISTAMATNSDPNNESEKPVTTDEKVTKLSEEELAVLTNRVEEIKDMDKSKMTSKERRALRKEVREINTEVRASNGGGVYIGVGTLLLIIILILIL